jgi:NTE family protein
MHTLAFRRLRHRADQARLRRASGRPTVAFVLSGGGNHGVAQIGMLRALFEREILPDVIVGTSVGALNGAAIAADPTMAAVDRLTEVWSGITAEDIFPGGRWSRTWRVVRKDTHLIANTGIASLVERFVVGSFHDLTVPLRVVATDLATGDETVFAAGPLGPALMASTALPGLLPPVEHGGRRCIDGAVVNNVPVAHAFASPGAPGIRGGRDALGPVRVYVLNVSGPIKPRELRHPGDALLQAFAIARRQRFDIERTTAPVGTEVIELPIPEDDRTIFDFSGGEAIREAAYQQTCSFLDHHPFDSLERRPSRLRRSRSTL